MTNDEWEIWQSSPRELERLLEAVDRMVHASSSREADRSMMDVIEVWWSVFPDDEKEG